jgi:hypothetical protein
MIFSLQTKEDSSEELKTAQQKFVKWGRMIEKLESGKLRGHFQLINGALFTLPTRATETYPRLCIPPGEFRREILKQITICQSPVTSASNELWQESDCGTTGQV